MSEEKDKYTTDGEPDGKAKGRIKAVGGGYLNIINGVVIVGEPYLLKREDRKFILTYYRIPVDTWQALSSDPLESPKPAAGFVLDKIMPQRITITEWCRDQFYRGLIRREQMLMFVDDLNK